MKSSPTRKLTSRPWLYRDTYYSILFLEFLPSYSPGLFLGASPAYTWGLNPIAIYIHNGQQHRWHAFNSMSWRLYSGVRILSMRVNRGFVDKCWRCWCQILVRSKDTEYDKEGSSDLYSGSSTSLSIDRYLRSDEEFGFKLRSDALRNKESVLIKHRKARVEEAVKYLLSKIEPKLSQSWTEKEMHWLDK